MFTQINGSESVGSGYFVNLAVGTYDIVITDSRGCVGSAFATVDPIPRMKNSGILINGLTLLHRNYNYNGTVIFMLWSCDW